MPGPPRRDVLRKLSFAQRFSSGTYQTTAAGAASARRRAKRYSAFAPEAVTTFAHFCVSARITLPKSSGVPFIGRPPRSA